MFLSQPKLRFETELLSHFFSVKFQYAVFDEDKRGFLQFLQYFGYVAA